MPDWFTIRLDEADKACLEDLLNTQITGTKNYSLVKANLLTRLRATMPDTRPDVP